MKGMDIPALEIFVAAVEEKSLSRAAERQNLVTSTASKRITELERYLRKTLLHRHGRGVEPTPAGALLYQRAKAILRNMQLAEAAVGGFASDGMAKIRLASNPSTLLQFLPTQMARYLANQDKTRVDLLECHSYDIPRMVADGSADIGIYHADRPAPGVISYPYNTDRIGLVVPLGHPLAKHESLHFEAALDYDLLGNFPRHSLEQFLAYIGRDLVRPPNVKLQVANFESRCRMIREGLGIAVLPERIAANYLSSMGLVLIPLEDEWALRQFYVCILDSRRSPPEISALLDVLLERD